jgi:hypothetical protein
MFLWILSLGVFKVFFQTAAAGEQVTLNKWKQHAIAILPDRAMFIQGANVNSDDYPNLMRFDKD